MDPCFLTPFWYIVVQHRLSISLHGYYTTFKIRNQPLHLEIACSLLDVCIASHLAYNEIRRDDAIPIFWDDKWLHLFFLLPQL